MNNYKWASKIWTEKRLLFLMAHPAVWGCVSTGLNPPPLTVKTSGDVSWAVDSRNRCISSSFIVVEWLWIPGIFCLATCCRCHRGLCGNWERKHSPATVLGIKMKLIESLLCGLGDGVFPCFQITPPPDSHPLFLVAELLVNTERCSSAAQHSTHVPFSSWFGYWALDPHGPDERRLHRRAL